MLVPNYDKVCKFTEERASVFSRQFVRACANIFQPYYLLRQVFTNIYSIYKIKHLFGTYKYFVLLL